METLIQELIATYGTQIISTVLAAIIAFVSAKIKALYEEHVNTETKEKVVKTVVGAVEQLYKDLDGPEKLEKAKENIIALLEEKGLSITELEMDMLIESACNCLNQNKVNEVK